MNATITVILAAAVIGYFAYNNYNLRGEIGRLETQVSDLEAAVGEAQQKTAQVTQEKDAELQRLRSEMSQKEQQGISEESLKAKDKEIAELKASIEKGKALVKTQQDQINWHKAQLRKYQDMVNQGM